MARFKKILNVEFVSIFVTTFVCNISHSKNSVRYDRKYVLVNTYKVLIILV